MPLWLAGSMPVSAPLPPALAQTLPKRVAMPIAARRMGSALEVDLTHADAREFRDPFFVETLERLGSIGTETRSAIRPLRSPESAVPIAPAGIIFHVSRCGSTHLANLLRATGCCISLSEPPAVNDLLMPPHGDWHTDEITAGLELLASDFATAAGGQPYVLKLRSWNTLMAPQILRAFPTTPWVFLIRDQLEVAVSVLRKPPTWLRFHGQLDNPFLAYLPPTAQTTDYETYLAQFLGAFADVMAGIDRSRGMLVRYEALGPETWLAVAAHFGLEVTEPGRRRMAGRSLIYSKDLTGQTRFAPDGEAKRTEASAGLRLAISHHTQPLFERLIHAWSAL